MTTRDCAGTKPAGATTYSDDTLLGKRTMAVAPPGDTTSYRYDQANRLTTATVPDTGLTNPGEYTALAAPVKIADSQSTFARGTDSFCLPFNLPFSCGGCTCER